MKFESSITSLKHFVIKGVALSLICIAGETLAGVYTVTDVTNQAGDGTLSWAVELGNRNPGSTINFSSNLAEGVRVQPVDAGWAFTANTTVDALLPKNLSILGASGVGSLFQVDKNVQLTLIGNNVNNAVATDKVSWNGTILNNGELTFHQRETSTYPFVLSGTGSVTAQVAPGQTLTFSAQSTYTGSTTVTSGTLATAMVNDALPPTRPLNIPSGAAFTVGGGLTQTVGDLSGAGNLNINGTSFTLNSTNNDTFSGVITGTGNFINAGIGILTLSGASTATGILTINNGSGGIIIPTGGGWSGPVQITNSTLQMNGGTVSGAISGDGTANSILNVTGNFRQTAGIVNVGTININNGANFTQTAAITNAGTININNAVTLAMNNPVSVSNAVNVNSGGTLLLNNNLGGAGTLINAGTITHAANATRTIAGNFTQQSTGTMNITISNPTQYSQFQVNGNTTLNGGVMNVVLPTSTALNGGETFSVIHSGTLTNNALPTVSRFSLFLGLTPIVNGTTLQLVSNRTSYKTANTIPALDGIATELDRLRVSDQLNALVGFVDGISSQDQYEKVLEQLAPSGLNGGTYVPQGLGAADQILTRLDTIRAMGAGGALARAGYARTGYAAGDMLEDQGSYGPIIFGNSTKQATKNGLPGYNAFTAGIGVLWDLPILQYFRVGLGISYASSAVKQSDNTGSNTTIGNTQGMAYGSATYGPLFLDSVLSVGVNNYNGKRNIPSFGQTATSTYMGSQYGVKVKTGFSLPCYQIEISPIAGVQYMHLNVGKYTEKGAPGRNQAIDATQSSTVRVSLGGRIADRSQEEDFFPEIHAFYLVDVRNPNVLITSRFVDGGGSFVSKGVLPPKAGINIGASITALVYDNFVVSGGYDLEAKKTFRSHSASLKFKYLF